MPVKGEKYSSFLLEINWRQLDQVYLSRKIMRCPMKKLLSVDFQHNIHGFRTHRRTWSRENEPYGVSFKQKRGGGQHSRPINIYSAYGNYSPNNF